MAVGTWGNQFKMVLNEKRTFIRLSFGDTPAALFFASDVANNFGTSVASDYKITLRVGAGLMSAFESDIELPFSFFGTDFELEVTRTGIVSGLGTPIKIWAVQVQGVGTTVYEKPTWIEGTFDSRGQPPIRVTAAILASTVLTPDSERHGITVHNNSTQKLAVLAAEPDVAIVNVGAGTELWTLVLDPSGYWECPFRHTGSLQLVWFAADATGEALVQQFFAQA